MHRSLFCALTVVLLGAAYVRNDEAVTKELKKFEGTWKIESLEIDGVKLPEQATKSSRLVLQGDRFTMTEAVATYKGKFKVDVNKKPKTIDLVFSEGPEKGKTNYGIYELDGDSCKLCIDMGAKKRPKEFATRPGSGCGLEVLKRQKPQK